MAKQKLDRYYFIELSDRNSIEAETKEQAIEHAVSAGLIETSRLDEYAIVVKYTDGSFNAGTPFIDVDWGIVT